MKKMLVACCTMLVASTSLAGQKAAYSIDGQDYEGYFSKAQGPSKGLVVLVHDWDGLTDYEVKRSEMLAALGYDAFAVDLYGKGNRPTQMQDKKAETKKLYSDRQKMRSLILGGYREAKKHSPEKAVVAGYCFGGAVTLELARSGQAGDAAGFVTFHGGLATPAGQSYAPDTAPIFVAHGGADKAVKMSAVSDLSAQLEAAGVAYEIEIYSGAPHAFTVFGSQRYREAADKKSWAAFGDFLNEVL